MNNFESFSNTFFKFKDNIDINTIFESVRNINFESVAKTIMTEIVNMNNYHKNKNIIERTDNICINANIELFDIYNNVKKTTQLSLTRICYKCKGKGVSYDKHKCDNCNGLKIVDKMIEISFYCMFKNTTLFKYSNEEINKLTGNIYINIVPKNHKYLRIIDEYNILYQFELEEENIDNKTLSIKKDIRYLDLNKYEINIFKIQPQSSIIYEFKINNYGLYIPNNERGNLIIQVIDKCNLINTKLKNIHSNKNHINFVKL